MELPKYYFSGEFSAFEELLRQVGGQPATYELGDYLAYPGEWNGKCFYVRKGIHVLSGVGADGKDSLMMLLGPGSVYPFACERKELFQDLWLSSRAASPMEVLVLTRERLRQAVAQSSALALTGIQQHCDIEHTLLMQRLFHSGGASRFKVGTFLYLYDQEGPKDDGMLYLTQENIAGFVDLSRMQVSRVLRELRQLGILQTSWNHIRVLDPAGLEKWCIEQWEE